MLPHFLLLQTFSVKVFANFGIVPLGWTSGLKCGRACQAVSASIENVRRKVRGTLDEDGTGKNSWYRVCLLHIVVLRFRSSLVKLSHDGALPCAQLMRELARSYKGEVKAMLMRETMLSTKFGDCTCRGEIACRKRGGTSNLERMFGRSCEAK